MTDSTTNEATNEIPYGYCRCGCGQKTNTYKGKPRRYIIGHQGRKTIDDPGPNPSGLCMCGCGEPTPIATWSRKRDGHVKGKPIQYIHHHRKQMPIEHFFWPKVDKRGHDDCWEWKGAKNSDGYGNMASYGKSLSAHRVSYEIHYGPIPDGLFVCHNCPDGDNPACVNPSHLFLGNHRDNMVDMTQKGRGRPPLVVGEDSTSAKLTETEVREIIELRNSGMTQRSIAERFGVSQTNVSNIVLRKSWKHLA